MPCSQESAELGAERSAALAPPPRSASEGERGCPAWEGEGLWGAGRAGSGVRLASGGFVVLVLLVPTLLATPGLDEGPLVAFTYEVMAAMHRTGPYQATLDMHGDKVGIAWTDVSLDVGTSSYRTEMLVRDGAITHRMMVPWSSWQTSIFDGEGRFHVLSIHRRIVGQEHDSYITTWSNGTWTTRFLTTAEMQNKPDSFVHDGVPHFAVPMTQLPGEEPNGRIYRLNMDTDEWEVLTNLPTYMGRVRATADPEGRIHIIHKNGPNLDYHSIYANGSWTTQSAPYHSPWWDAQDIAIDENGRPVFAYAEGSGRIVRVVKMTPEGAYVDELVSTRKGWDHALAVAPDGVVHLTTTYSNGISDWPGDSTTYYHARSLEGVWSTQAMWPMGAHYYPDLTLDDAGYPAIALPNNRNQDILATPAGKAVTSIVLARGVAAHAAGVPSVGSGLLG